MAGLYSYCYAAARPEFPRDRGSSGLDGLDNVVEDAIDGFLMKYVAVAEGEQVELQRFALEAELAGNVIDDDTAEVRLARDRAEGGELRAIELDAVVPGAVDVVESLQPCFCRGGRKRRPAASEKCQLFVFPACIHSNSGRLLRGIVLRRQHLV